MNDPNFQREVMRAIGQLEGTIKEGFKSMDSQFCATTTRLNTHSAKINTLEKFCDNWSGKMSIVAGVFGIIGSIAFAFIKKVFNL